jgi:hypothetical protein
VSLYALAAVLALVTALVKLRSTEAAEDRKWVEQVQQLLAVPPAEDGQLPRLSTVSPSRYGSEGPAGTDTYVRRNADDELDHALRNKPFVLVADSRAGKSRTAAEAARRLTLKGICPGCGLPCLPGAARECSATSAGSGSRKTE